MYDYRARARYLSPLTKCIMSKMPPIYFLYYGIGKNPVAVYSLAFRVFALIKNFLRLGYVSKLELFRVERVGLVRGSEFKISKKDISDSIIRVVKND